MKESDQDLEISSTAAVIVGLVLALPIFYLFSHFGEPGRGSVSIVFIMGVAIAILDSKKMWRGLWFWVLVACLLLIHSALIAFIRWPVMEDDGQALGGAVLIDLLFCVGFIRSGTWLITKHRGQCHK